ncbi:MAG: NAD(P)H-dependent oxidoreductase [Vicingaceae bacterium]
MEIIEGLKWRYATKKFDPTKKLSKTDLEKLKEAIQLSASSYGLQLYKVLIIEDEALRKKLKPAAWDQPQILDASHLLIFCNETSVTEENIQEHIQLKADTVGVDAAKLKGYGDFIYGQWKDQSPEAQSNWTAKQTYIALGNLVAACGEMKIDACPMEGFEPAKVNEILGLEEKGLNAAVLATIGYRSEEDETKDAPKVRKSKDDLFEVH